MSEPWQEGRFLVLGLTYPSYSKKYVEISCTGALEADSLRMVRLMPNPVRLLESEKRMHDWEWIRVRWQQHDKDPRIDSLRIDPETIVREEPVTSHGERAQLLLDSPNLLNSLEELKERQRSSGMSLGVIEPRAVNEPRVHRRSEREAAEWAEREQATIGQGHLFEDHLPLDYIPWRFAVSWTCADDRCSGHESGLKKWGLHELSRRYADPTECREQCLEAMRLYLDSAKYRLFFMLGSFHNHQTTFGLMDTFSAKRSEADQLSLFH